MSNTHDPSRDRLLELLADRTVFGLTQDEAAELERLVVAFPDVDGEELERLAADLAMSSIPVPPEPMPAGVQARILADAAKHLPAQSTPTGSGSRRIRKVLGWAALVASVFLAIGVWWSTRNSQEPGPAERRAQLLARAAQPGSDVIQIEWTATPDPAAKGASGDVVWSTTTQEGYMRFRGLAANTPTREQYQLWVFDAVRDERYPVDGGVFDIPPGGGDVIIPIRTKLGVTRPVLFAITVEPPGGVVVSSRERLPLVAKAPQQKPG